MWWLQNAEKYTYENALIQVFHHLDNGIRYIVYWRNQSLNHRHSELLQFLYQFIVLFFLMYCVV